MNAAPTVAVVALAGTALIVGAPSVALAGTGIGTYSKQNGTSQAEAGGSVTNTGSTPGEAGSPDSAPEGSYTPSTPTAGTPTSTTAISGGESVPYTGPDPNFRGAFRRTPGYPSGTACLYFPDAPGVCPVAPAPVEPPRGRGRARAPPIDPFAIAASIARNMPLLPGEISANPARAGWTGVPAWFWLEPAPRTVAAVAALGAEQIVVTAVPDPAWSFGDESTPLYGTGRPYSRGGGSVDGAIRHRYESRCLPGDQGHNPYVLASCGSGGYEVAANVTWTISFVATGPVAAAGPLPSRTTSTGVNYPVSEVRAFLTDGDGGAS